MGQPARQRRLEIERLDKHLRSLQIAESTLRTVPATGWIRTIREALGMSAAQLAQRLGVSRDAVYKLEERETGRNVTLKQLDKAAEALDCEVLYALVPRQSLEQTIRDRARHQAEQHLRATNASMGLEAEGVEANDFATAVSSASSYTEALTDRHLWDD
jgi:predicted DNA-binding mobile mystery protein A